MKDFAALNISKKSKLTLLIVSAISLGLASPAQGRGGIAAAGAVAAGHLQASAAESAGSTGPAMQEAYVETPDSNKRPPLSLVPPSVPYWNGWVSGAVGSTKADDLKTGANGRLELGTAFFLPRNLGGEVTINKGSEAHHSFFTGDGLLFWRRPAQGLFAAHYQYAGFAHTYSNLYGLRADGYINDWTVSVEGGSAHTNIYGGRGYGDLAVFYYADPDWRVDGSYFVTNGAYAFQLGTEYQFGLPSWTGLTMFADLGGGNNGLRYGNIGLRYYFGCPKPLIRRQREDMVDPNRGLVYKEALPGAGFSGD